MLTRTWYDRVQKHVERPQRYGVSLISFTSSRHRVCDCPAKLLQHHAKCKRSRILRTTHELQQAYRFPLAILRSTNLPAVGSSSSRVNDTDFQQYPNPLRNGKPLLLNAKASPRVLVSLLNFNRTRDQSALLSRRPVQAFGMHPPALQGLLEQHVISLERRLTAAWALGHDNPLPSTIIESKTAHLIDLADLHHWQHLN